MFKVLFEKYHGIGCAEGEYKSRRVRFWVGLLQCVWVRGYMWDGEFWSKECR